METAKVGNVAVGSSARLWVGGAGLLLMSVAWAQAGSPGAADANAAAPPARAVRSVLFDAAAADDRRLRLQPVYIESIVIEGRDPDTRRAPRKPLEQRFSDALNASKPAAAAGMRMMDTTPCMSVQSTWNSIGSSFAPLAGCP
jgi:hypothetical protein